MSADLISRQVVMDYLQEQQAKVIIEKNKCGFVSKDVCEGMHSAINAFINFIVQTPTSFDVDKVVCQMEREAKRWQESGEEYEDQKELGVAEGYRLAIEIVKAGGVNEQSAANSF